MVHQHFYRRQSDWFTSGESRSIRTHTVSVCYRPNPLHQLVRLALPLWCSNVNTVVLLPNHTTPHHTPCCPNSMPGCVTETPLPITTPKMANWSLKFCQGRWSPLNVGRSIVLCLTAVCFFILYIYIYIKAQHQKSGKCHCCLLSEIFIRAWFALEILATEELCVYTVDVCSEAKFSKLELSEPQKSTQSKDSGVSWLNSVWAPDIIPWLGSWGCIGKQETSPKNEK